MAQLIAIARVDNAGAADALACRDLEFGFRVIVVSVEDDAAGDGVERAARNAFVGKDSLAGLGGAGPLDQEDADQRTKATPAEIIACVRSPAR